MPSLGLSKQYLSIGVAGYRTFAAENEAIGSCVYHQDAEKSSVWDYVVKKKDDHRVFKSYCFAHMDRLHEVTKLLQQTSCQYGLVVMANSWGAALANQIAYRYYRRCQKLADFFVLVDGISKPFFFSYTSPIWSARCLNYYQLSDWVHGDEISGCQNTELSYQQTTGTRHHIRAEWEGGKRAKQDIMKFLRLNPLPKEFKNLEEHPHLRRFDMDQEIEQNKLKNQIKNQATGSRLQKESKKIKEL